jgi:hypothetical protein
LLEKWRRQAPPRYAACPLHAVTNFREWRADPMVLTINPMVLTIKKSQTTSLLGRVIFMIDARMEVAAEERRLVGKYGLGDLLVYSSTGSDQQLAAMKARKESTKVHPGFWASLGEELMGAFRMLLTQSMAGAHATMAAYDLKITASKLLRGVHIYCTDMDEVIVAKNAIVQAGKNLRKYLDVAQSFDGSEEIHEF